MGNPDRAGNLTGGDSLTRPSVTGRSTRLGFMAAGMLIASQGVVFEPSGLSQADDEPSKQSPDRGHLEIAEDHPDSPVYYVPATPIQDGESLSIEVVEGA